MDNLQTDISTAIQEEVTPVFPYISFKKEVDDDKFTDYTISTCIRKKADDGNYYLQLVQEKHRVGSMELYNGKYEDVILMKIISKFNLMCSHVILFGRITSEMLKMEKKPGVKTYVKCVNQENERRRLKNLMS